MHRLGVMKGGGFTIRGQLRVSALHDATGKGLRSRNYPDSIVREAGDRESII
jgi:hypothetical protein